MVKIYDKLPPRNSPWLSFYQPSTKVNSNPRMFRYCRKLSINHCSSDQSERNKSCIPDPATICTLLNEYIHKRLLKTSLFVNMIFLSHHKRPRVILPQEIVKKFFAHSLKKQTQQNQTKGKNRKEKGHDIHGNYTKREDFNIFLSRKSIIILSYWLNFE